MASGPGSPATGVEPNTSLDVGFNLGFAINTPPDVQLPLQTAQAVSQALSSKLANNITTSVADAAVTTDTLAAKLQVPIQQVLGNAAQTIVGLHQPIQTEIAGRMGGAMESALKVGAIPPNPNNLGVMPAMVQIRTAAEQGDLGPALDYYRATALPFVPYGGMQYAQPMQAIINALPQDDRTQTAFATAVQAINTDGLVSPGNSAQAAACNAEIALELQQAQTQCQALYPNDPAAYAACVTSAQQAAARALVACGQTPPGQIPHGGSPSTPNGSPPNIPTPSPTPAPGIPSNVPGVPLPGTTTPGTGPTKQPPVTPPQAAGGGSGGSPVVPPATGPGGPGVTGGTAGGAPAGGTIATPPSLGLTAGEPIGILPPGTQVTPCKDYPGYTCVINPGGGQSVIPFPGDPDHPITPPTTTTTTSASAPQQSQTGGLSCDAVAALIQALQVGATDYSQVAQSVQQQSGYATYVSNDAATCSSGYKWFPSGPVPWSGGSDDGYGYCVKCPSGTQSPTATSSGCCPVTVNVNCPPPATSPTGPTSSSQQPPNQTPAPPQQPQPGQAVPQQIGGCDEFGPAPGVQLQNGFQDLSKLFGLRNADGTLNMSWIPAGTTQLVQIAVAPAMGFIASIVDQIGNTMQSIASQSGCANGEQMALVGVAVVARFLERFVGDAVKSITEPNRQQREYLCPTELPGIMDSALAWLGNTIDEATLECWTRAAGSRYPERKAVVDAMRAKFPLLQIGSLYLRGQLTDQQLNDRVRELGMTQGTEVGELKELLKQIPPPSDLVRFMVRDTADDALVQKFGMDTDFQIKYGQQIKDWAKASGVSDDYMQSVWRAHWSIPSPGQLFEMLHRSASLPPGDPGAVTQDDVETALEQQDILPYWIPKFLNISYRPLTRVDARRAFQIGSLDEAGLTKSYTDQGYSAADANILVQYNKNNNLLVLMGSSPVKQMAAGYLTDDQFTQQLKIRGADDSAIAQARSQAELIASVNSRKACVAAYKKRYLLGDTTPADVQQQLISAGVPADLAVKMLAGWQCELASRGKAIAASDLATLYSQGVIDAPDLTRRLQYLGYAYNDAVLLARKIATISQQRISKQEQLAMRQQEAEALRDQKQQNQAVQTAARQAAKAAAQVLSMQKTNVMREKRLIEAGGSMAKASGMTLSDAVLAVKSVYRGLLSSSSWLPDEIIAAVVTAAKDGGATTAELLATQTQQILAS